MISAAGLHKVYRDGSSQVKVLDGLDLDVRKGEFVAVVGSSGSGKSTLLHIVGGLDVDYTGSVSVADTRVTGLGEKPLARFRNERVGFVFQSFHLIPNMAAVENVLLPSHFGVRVSDARKRALDALDRVGLGGKADRVPAKLSGGERQRVAIARALFANPVVLLADEPTGNLDSATGESIIDLFRTLHRDGLTILAVTHEQRLSSAAERVVRLHQGKLSVEVTR